MNLRSRPVRIAATAALLPLLVAVIAMPRPAGAQVCADATLDCFEPPAVSAASARDLV